MTAPYLGNPKRTIEVLQKYEFVFQKKFGQNFLCLLYTSPSPRDRG